MIYEIIVGHVVQNIDLKYSKTGKMAYPFHNILNPNQSNSQKFLGTCLPLQNVNIHFFINKGHFKGQKILHIIRD